MRAGAKPTSAAGSQINKLWSVHTKECSVVQVVEPELQTRPQLRLEDNVPLNSCRRLCVTPFTCILKSNASLFYIAKGQILCSRNIKA